LLLCNMSKNCRTARFFYILSALTARARWLFLHFLVFGVLALHFAKFGHFQLAFHCLGFVGAIINAFASRTLHFNIRFLFCCHISN